MHLVVVVLVALAVPHRPPTGGRPKAAIPQLGHRTLGRLAPAAIAEAAVGACSAVLLAGDPIGSVGEVRQLQIAGAALGDTVPQVVVADHEPCCGRDYSSAQQEAAARPLLVQKGLLPPEVQQLLHHEGHPLVLPYQLWV
jgi:hypothetical protein